MSAGLSQRNSAWPRRAAACDNRCARTCRPAESAALFASCFGDWTLWQPARYRRQTLPCGFHQRQRQRGRPAAGVLAGSIRAGCTVRGFECQRLGAADLRCSAVPVLAVTSPRGRRDTHPPRPAAQRPGGPDPPRSEFLQRQPAIETVRFKPGPALPGRRRHHPRRDDHTHRRFPPQTDSAHPPSYCPRRLRTSTFEITFLALADCKFPTNSPLDFLIWCESQSSAARWTSLPPPPAMVSC